MKIDSYHFLWVWVLILPASIIAQDHQDYINAEDAYKSKAYEACGDSLAKIIANKMLYHDSTMAACYKLKGDLFLKEFNLAATVLQYKIADSIYMGLGDEFAAKHLNVVNKMGICYARQENLILTAKYFQSAYDIAVENFLPTDINVGKATNNLATVYLYLGDFEKSLIYFHKSIAIKEQFANENPTPLAITYENIASIYGQINQMAKAESYLQKAGQLYLQEHEGNVNALAGYYINLAGFYLENGKEDDAIAQLNLAVDLPEKYKENKLVEILIDKNFGVAYLQKKNLSLALSHFKKSLAMADRYKVSNKDRTLVLSHMASIYTYQNKTNMAKSALVDARSILLESYEKTHKNYLSVLQQHVFILLKLEDLQGAWSLIQEYESVFDLRNEDAANDLLFSSLKMGLYAAKLNYYLVSYQRNQQASILEKGIEIADEVINYQDQILASIVDKEDRLYFFQNAYSNFSAAVYLYISKYKGNNEKVYLEKAFHLTEKTKQYSLKEARGFQNITMSSAIPLDIIEQEKQAKIAWSQAVSKYENQLDGNTNPSVNLQMIQEVDSLKQVFQAATKSLADSSPLLANYLSYEENFEITNIQNWLDNMSRMYVSYYLSGNDFVKNNYAFVINSKGLQVTDLIPDKDSLNSVIGRLANSLHLDASVSDKNYYAYEKPASILYSSLVEPLALTDLTGVIFNLDQKLHSLPLEVLMNPKTKKFLIEERSVSYAYSVNAINRGLIDYDIAILTSCPTFTGEGDMKFTPLQNNKNEVKEIYEIIGSDDYTIEDKIDFQNLVTQNSFNVIHLATHAKANHDKGYQSYLAFGDSSSQLLYSREIYGLPISANLVVLSACETGDGELVESQGVRGLATSFAATGTNSLVASLWSVDDVATKEVMVPYYKNLKNGMLKDDAMREAKMYYISTVPKSKKHPYFWAGFTQTGAIGALEFGSVGHFSIFQNGMLFCMALTIVLGLYLLLKRKRATSV